MLDGMPRSNDQRNRGARNAKRGSEYSRGKNGHTDASCSAGARQHQWPRACDRSSWLGLWPPAIAAAAAAGDERVSRVAGARAVEARGGAGRLARQRLRNSLARGAGLGCGRAGKGPERSWEEWWVVGRLVLAEYGVRGSDWRRWAEEYKKKEGGKPMYGSWRFSAVQGRSGGVDADAECRR